MKDPNKDPVKDPAKDAKAKVKDAEEAVPPKSSGKTRDEKKADLGRQGREGRGPEEATTRPSMGNPK